MCFSFIYPERGYEVHILVDGVSSQRQGDRSIALQRLSQSGAFLSSSGACCTVLCGSLLQEPVAPELVGSVILLVIWSNAQQFSGEYCVSLHLHCSSYKLWNAIRLNILGASLLVAHAWHHYDCRDTVEACSSLLTKARASEHRIPKRLTS